MAETTGKVGFVKVNATPFSNFALAGVLDSSTEPPIPEIFFVWFAPGEQNVPTGPQWMQRAMQVSLFREALTSGMTVTVFHDDTSPFVNSVQINS